MMNDSISSNATSSVMGLLTIGAIAGAIALFIWEAYGPAESSVIVNIGGKLGAAEGRFLEAQEQQRAQYEGELAATVAEVQTLYGAYNTLYNTHAGLIAQAYQWEGQILTAQSQALSTSQVADRVGTNIASIACMVDSLLDTTGSHQSYKNITDGACAAEYKMRDTLIRDYAEYLPQHRTTIPQDMIEGLPSPDTLLSPEFQAILAKYSDTGSAQ